MERIKFLSIFIPNLDELIKTITHMLKKSNEFKWNKEEKETFETLNRSMDKHY